MTGQHDVLIDKAIADINHGDRKAVATDLQNILLRDTDLSNPNNKNQEVVRAHLQRDGAAIHAATGLDNNTLSKLGFPVADGSVAENLMKQAVSDVQHGNNGALQQDLQKILERDAKASDPAGTQARLKKDHELLHAAGLPDNTLVKLGFPMPDVTPHAPMKKS